MGPDPAARAFVNARVHVMDAPERTEDALLWARGRVVAVGDPPTIRRRARALGAPVEDLEGRVVLPGFVDAHTHFLHVGLKRTRADLRGARSLGEALDRLAAWLRAHSGPAPAIADGWDESEWRDPTRPTRRDVDAALDALGQGGRPVVLRRIDGHTAVAGSAALPALQAHFPKPGLVDASTGVLLEEASLYLNEAFPASPAELDRALEEAQREAHRLGVTTVGDYQQAPYREAVRRAARRGTLTVRIASSIYPQQMDAELARGFRTGRPGPGPPDPEAAGGDPPGARAADCGPSEWLRDGGLKVFLDGSLGAHTAHLREPYLDGPPPGQPCTHPHPRGASLWSDADLDRLFGAAHAAGVQVHAHAIGDAAIDQGLEAFARLAAREDLEGEGWQGNHLRHRFEHYEIVHDAQVARTAELGIVASSQPNFVGAWSAKGGMYEGRLGPRFRLNNRFRTFQEAGVRVAFGSDGMPFGPLVGLQAAVAHPEAPERLAPAEAIWRYTREAAWALHWEDGVGSLEPGRHADLLVLDVHGLEERTPASWRILRAFTGGLERPLPGS